MKSVSVADATLAPFRTALIDWLDAHDAEAVLVRPDRYVFGAGDGHTLALAWQAAVKAICVTP